MSCTKPRSTLSRALAALCVVTVAGCGHAAADAEADSSRLAASGKSEAAPVVRAAPDLSSCRPVEGGVASALERDKPLPVPDALSGTVASGLDHLAVATLAGGTVCVETQWIESTDGMELSSDGRFMSFAWYGYEAYGYMLVDRSGNGAVVETGVKPSPAPGGELIAALEYTESGFGSLNALGIWRISSWPIRELAMVQFPDGLTQWRFDGWKGDDCIEVSAIAFEQLGEDESRPNESARHRFVSRRGEGWKLAPAGMADCNAP